MHQSFTAAGAVAADCPVGMPSLDKLLRDPSDSITHGVNGFTPSRDFNADE